MGAMRTQFYALCFPNEIESIINFDGAMLPLGFGSTVRFSSFEMPMFQSTSFPYDRLDLESCPNLIYCFQHVLGFLTPCLIKVVKALQFEVTLSQLS